WRRCGRAQWRPRAWRGRRAARPAPRRPQGSACRWIACRLEQKTPPQRGFLPSLAGLLLDALELDVDATVLLASFGRLVGRDGLGLALADRRDLRGRDALAHQVVLDRSGAAL